MRKNNLPLGLGIGLGAPIIGVLIFYFWKASSSRLVDFITMAFENKSFLTAMVSFSLLINAICFTYYVNRRLDKTAIGIFAATLVYAIPTIIIKLLMK